MIGETEDEEREPIIERRIDEREREAFGYFVTFSFLFAPLDFLRNLHISFSQRKEHHRPLVLHFFFFFFNIKFSQ